MIRRHKLTPTEITRKRAGLVLLKTLHNEKSVVSKPVKSSHAANVPKSAATSLDQLIKNENCHEVYGSLAMRSHSFLARKPNDVDLIVRNPNKTASNISQTFRRKGLNTRVEKNPQFGSAVVQVEKNSKWLDVADLHPIQDHYGNFEVFGSSKMPRTLLGVNIQPAADQLLRKGNSIMGYNTEEKRMGPAAKRRLKDNSDFITTTRILLDSKELRAKAELERVKKARKKLAVWKKHVRTMPGYNKAKTHIGRDPIPASKEKEFINYAVNNLDVHVDDIYFSGSGIKRRSKNITSPVCPFGKKKTLNNPYRSVGVKKSRGKRKKNSKKKDKLTLF